MAGRGSGIGLGAVGGLGPMGVGGSATSTRPAAAGQLYGPRVRGMGGKMAVHHWLWVLVLLEVGFLVAMRAIVFKNYHGG